MKQSSRSWIPRAYITVGADGFIETTRLRIGAATLNKEAVFCVETEFRDRNQGPKPGKANFSAHAEIPTRLVPHVFLGEHPRVPRVRRIFPGTFSPVAPRPPLALS